MSSSIMNWHQQKQNLFLVRQIYRKWRKHCFLVASVCSPLTLWRRLSTEIALDKILDRFLSTVWNIIVFLIQGAYSCKTPPAIETQSNERCYVVANVVICFCKISSNHISFYSHPSELPHYFKAVKIIISIPRKATAEIYWASWPNITQQILSVLKFSHFKDNMHPTGRFF